MATEEQFFGQQKGKIKARELQEEGVPKTLKTVVNKGRGDSGSSVPGTECGSGPLTTPRKQRRLACSPASQSGQEFPQQCSDTHGGFSLWPLGCGGNGASQLQRLGLSH